METCPLYPKQKEQSCCSICLCELDNDEAASLEICKHKFCKECIKSWAKKSENKCPICRETFRKIKYRSETGKYVYVRVRDKEQINYIGDSYDFQVNYDQEESDDDMECHHCKGFIPEDDQNTFTCSGCQKKVHFGCFTTKMNVFKDGHFHCQDCEILHKEHRKGKDSLQLFNCKVCLKIEVEEVPFEEVQKQILAVQMGEQFHYELMRNGITKKSDIKVGRTSIEGYELLEE